MLPPTTPPAPTPRHRPSDHRRSRRPRLRNTRRERGSVSVEMTMLVWPVAVVMAAFIAGGWILTAARQDVHAAAGSAARAASLQTHPAAAAATAEQATTAALADAGRRCADLTVIVDTANFTHGGYIAVTVDCRADLAGLIGLDLPGSTRFATTARVPIETHRQLEEQR